MLDFIARRLIAIIPVLAVVAIFVFLMLRLTPGDPAAVIAGDNATSDQIADIRAKLGLNEPIWTQFAIWIGDPDKNRAWDLLVEAKRAFDRVVSEGRLDEGQRAEAARQLAHCEASDWFWWLGGDNSATNVAQFERLFRLHLAALYQMLGEPVPDQLTRPFAHGLVDGAGSAMRGGH